MAPHSPQASQCTQAPVAGCGSGQWCQDGAAAWLQHLQLPSCPSCTGAMGLREGIAPSAQINLQILVVVSFSFPCSGGSGSPRASCHLLPEGAGWFGSVSKAELVPVWCQRPQGCQCPVGALRVPSGCPQCPSRPQGCSGRSCTAWRGWRAWWRSGSATRSPAPMTSSAPAARSPAQPGVTPPCSSPLPHLGDGSQAVSVHDSIPGIA